MWLDTLKELKKEKQMSAKQIAEKANMSERTVSRIFSGDTDAPYVDTLQRIAAALDASLDDILGDSKAVVGTKNLATLQEEVNRLTAENEMLTAKNTVLESKVTSLSSEIDMLRLKLEHKEEIIALHNMYGAVLGGLAKGQTKKSGKE